MPKILLALFSFLLPFPGMSQISLKVFYTRCDTVQTCELYIFTGSDWCPNCRRLEKKVLVDTSFVRTMKENGIAVKMIDFPQRIKLEPEVQKHNREIADKYGFAGVYPTLVLVNSRSGHFMLFYYQNQNSAEYTPLILENKAKLDE